MQETQEIAQAIEESTLEVYSDVFLKFSSEEQAKEILYNPEDDSPKYNLAIDTVGLIYKPTGEILQGEDGEYPEMQAIEGWHVNARGLIPLELLPFAVQPQNPVRVWA